MGRSTLIGLFRGSDPGKQSASTCDERDLCARPTHFVTSPGNFLSFQTPRSKAPPSIGKSDLSTPFRVPTEPGDNEILRMYGVVGGGSRMY